MKSILITGASGFIGRNLASSLNKQVSNLFLVSRSNGIDFVEANWIERLPEEHIDIVIHLAQSSQYRIFPEGAEDMFEVNIAATTKLLEWARNKGVAKFIYASTVNVYAKSKYKLLESNPTAPDSFYAATKLAAEHLVLQYENYFQVDILRLFTVYGVGQKSMLIPNIIDRIKTKKTITLADGIGLYLTPIYVNDVVDIIIKVINTNSKITARLMNVCSDVDYSLLKIISMLESIIGIEANTQLVKDEVKFLMGSNETLKQVLGPINFTSLETGLRSVVKFS